MFNILRQQRCFFLMSESVTVSDVSCGFCVCVNILNDIAGTGR